MCATAHPNVPVYAIALRNVPMCATAHPNVSMCATAHPHEHDVEVNLDQESHLYLHVLDDHHYVKHLRPAASRNDSVVVDMDLALLAVHGLVSQLLCGDC